MGRVACILVADFPLAAQLRANPALDGSPTVLADTPAPHAELIAVSARARSSGIKAGMTIAQARTRAQRRSRPYFIRLVSIGAIERERVVTTLKRCAISAARWNAASPMPITGPFAAQRDVFPMPELVDLFFPDDASRGGELDRALEKLATLQAAARRDAQPPLIAGRRRFGRRARSSRRTRAAHV